jgi:hypothetical protein
LTLGLRLHNDAALGISKVGGNMDDRIKRLTEQAEEAYERTHNTSLNDYSGNQHARRLGLHQARLSAWEDNKAALDAIAAIDPTHRTAEVSRARAEAERQIDFERDQVSRAQEKLLSDPF